MSCCDDCPHLKYVTIDRETGIIINVASLSMRDCSSEEKDEV